MTTYLFPGQGSQAKGMGEALFGAFPEYIKKANEILGYSMEALCLNDPNEQLNKTEYTQPALYVVNALSYLKKINETGKTPDYLAGHSLGEYSALFAAEVFDFETGLKLVQKRGFLMSQAKNGKMAAVIGLSAQKINEVIDNNNLRGRVSMANYNSNSQIVISGEEEPIIDSQPLFEAAGASLFVPLKVSGAFHSPLMESASAEFDEFLSKFDFASPKIPVFANINALPYQNDNIRSQLAGQITHPVLWVQTIKNLMDSGENEFEEIGPGMVLRGLVNRIRKGQ